MLGVMTSNGTVTQKVCPVEGCERRGTDRGLCHTHYEYKRRHGLLHEHPLPPPPTIYDRLTDLLVVPSGTECWEWNGPRHKRGYGNFWVREGEAKRTTFAHRIAAHLWLNMPLFAAGSVCHTCDNPPCCNPAHLYVGTQLENIHDALAKRRIAHKRKITPKQREEIRERRKGGESYKSIAKDYPVTWHHCWIICNGRKADIHREYQAIR